jgi:hypothetical protein
MRFKSTLFLKIAVILIGTPIFALGIFGLYDFYKYPLNLTNHELILFPIIIGIYLTGIPFYFALYQTFKLLGYIDKNNAFSELSVKALKNIKRCASSICIFYIAILPVCSLYSRKYDFPGLVILGIFSSFASAVIAVFTAVLQKLLKEAIAMKSENDSII